MTITIAAKVAVTVAATENSPFSPIKSLCLR